ncbi:MAG: DUF177 domain-containing protein [candidate division KSB1 bacterium]|nr:DUF177 domain-containing protein [candidate division KSB1 bacterium]MDZ7364660.1 DUF177 domain-containing protein [candidate division KSB1 bacterium]MDZ7402592.1 DUF177 domain-containing protein [candidate division KSB1 bacterium]
MKISLASLSEGLHTFNFVERLAEFGLENHPNLNDEVKIRIDMEKRSPQYVLKSFVQIGGRFACDRCTCEVEKKLSGEGQVIYSSDQAMLELSDADEIHYLAPDAKEIDLTPDLRDTILLAIPMKLLCSEECRGLCAGCGADLNIEACRCAAPPADPRWEALRKLL